MPVVIGEPLFFADTMNLPRKHTGLTSQQTLSPARWKEEAIK